MFLAEHEHVVRSTLGEICVDQANVGEDLDKGFTGEVELSVGAIPRPLHKRLLEQWHALLDHVVKLNRVAHFTPEKVGDIVFSVLRNEILYTHAGGGGMQRQARANDSNVSFAFALQASLSLSLSRSQCAWILPR